MREWSRDERYRVLQSADEITFLSVVPLGSGPRP